LKGCPPGGRFWTTLSLDWLARNFDDMSRIVHGLTKYGVRIEFIREMIGIYRQGLADGQSDAVSVWAFAEFERA
jgi:DNA invertase Pin-like site-specific DNA recombinase